MARFARKSDGRRIFTDTFKREQIGRISRGELTLAELSRKLGIARSLLQRWKRFMSRAAETARVARKRKTFPSELRAAQHIRELQLMLGRQTAGLDLLRVELDRLVKVRHSQRASRR